MVTNEDIEKINGIRKPVTAFEMTREGVLFVIKILEREHLDRHSKKPWPVYRSSFMTTNQFLLRRYLFKIGKENVDSFICKEAQRPYKCNGLRLTSG